MNAQIDTVDVADSIAGAAFKLSTDQLTSMRQYRLERFRAEMARSGVALAILTNPTSTRYVADVWSFPVFQSRIPVMYLAVPVSGPVISFGGFVESEADEQSIVIEHRPGRDTNTLLGGFDFAAEATAMGRDIHDVLVENGLDGGRVAIENISPLVTMALIDEGIAVTDAQPLVDRAKLIKCDEEVLCMRRSIAIAEVGIAALKNSLQPGLSEQSLWSTLFQVAMANGAEWFDSRQLVTGPRSNPPGREASERLVEDGDLVAFDTDMVGPLGYCADLSRTFHCGPSKPNPDQREIYLLAYDQLKYNMDLYRPGAGFREIVEKSYRCPDGFIPFVCAGHGLGMCDEYPFLHTSNQHGEPPYDGVLEPGMVMCVEAFCAKEGGREGVRLEEQIVIREDCYEVLTTYPFEEDLLS